MTTPFRVVVAPDKFKGSLRADEVARTITCALERGGPRVHVTQHPIADGGEGTVDLALAVGFDPVTVRVRGPLEAAVTATFALRAGSLPGMLREGATPIGLDVATAGAKALLSGCLRRSTA